MKDLKVMLIQADLVWENPSKNRANLRAKVDTVTEQVDLIVLPEMFSTGFTMNPYEVAESMQGETILWMQELAKSKKSAITGSLIIKENNNYYNRLVFVYPSGELETYDKRHTFTLAGEHEVYTAGNVEAYDLLVYVANWPKPRIAAWDSLLKARAIENMAYCIGVNRIGFDVNKHEYPGHSAAYNGLGEQLSSIPASSERTEIVILDAKHLQKTREKLQFLNDKDSFHLDI